MKMRFKLIAGMTALIVIISTGCSVVGPGQRGIRISLGKVSVEPKPPGAYLWIPFLLGMATVDVQIQKSTIEAAAASKDMQDIFADVAVNWSLSPGNVVKTYQDIGDEYEVEKRILIPAVAEVMKSASAKRTAEEVLTHRMEMKTDIDDVLKKRLIQYGITVHDVSIVNLKFSEGFTHAIEAKQIAEQQAKQAVYVKDKAIQDALAVEEQARGQGKAQALRRASLTPEILQQQAIEKWDGVLPKIVTTGSGMILDLKSLSKKE